MDTNQTSHTATKQDPHSFLLETAALFEKPMTKETMTPDSLGSTHTANTNLDLVFFNLATTARINALIQTRIDGMPEFEVSRDGTTFQPKTGTIVNRAAQVYYEKRLNRGTDRVPSTASELMELERLVKIKAKFERRRLQKEHRRVLDEARKCLRMH
ncbi:hypothetical protein HDU99_002948 [Rhizoclosmatium hyalinum]|nr:hypothetical protein HDU99_002948 [Rhizoclosmatium hyalinum]